MIGGSILNMRKEQLQNNFLLFYKEIVCVVYTVCMSSSLVKIYLRSDRIYSPLMEYSFAFLNYFHHLIVVTTLKIFLSKNIFQSLGIQSEGPNHPNTCLLCAHIHMHTHTLLMHEVMSFMAE